MLKCYAEAGVFNWASNIRKLLYMNGFGYIWESESVDNENQFLALFTRRLKNQYLQKTGLNILV